MINRMLIRGKLIKRIDKNLFLDLLHAIAEGVVLFTFVFLLKRLFDLTDLFVSGGASLTSTFGLVFSLLPSIMVQTFPMATLLAAMMVYGRLVSDNEFIALQAVGYSPAQLLVPAAITGIFMFSLMNVWAHYTAPKGLEYFRTVATDILRNSASTGIRPGSFTPPIGPFILFPSEIDDGQMRFLRMFEQRPDGQIAGVVASPSATIRFLPEENRLTLALEDGNLHQIPSPDRDIVMLYDQLQISLSMPQLLNRFAASSREAHRLLTPDLRERRDEYQQIYEETNEWAAHDRYQRISIEIAQRYAMPFACFIMVLMGALLGMRSGTGKRSSCYATTILVIFIYYIMMSFGETQFEDDNISAWVGIGAPNVVAGLFTLYLFWRSHRI